MIASSATPRRGCCLCSVPKYTPAVAAMTRRPTARRLLHCACGRPRHVCHFLNPEYRMDCRVRGRGGAGGRRLSLRGPVAGVAPLRAVAHRRERPGGDRPDLRRRPQRPIHGPVAGRAGAPPRVRHFLCDRPLRPTEAAYRACSGPCRTPDRLPHDDAPEIDVYGGEADPRGDRRCHRGDRGHDRQPGAFLSSAVWRAQSGSLSCCCRAAPDACDVECDFVGLEGTVRGGD